MSKIVMLSAQLAAPAILTDLLQKLGVQNPTLAQFIENLDTVPIIRECANHALQAMSTMPGISLDNSIRDYYGHGYKSHASLQLLGALKTSKLKNGIGVMVDSNGCIKFAADTFTNEWRTESARLQKLFQETFLQQVVKAILEVMGYQMQITKDTIKDPESGQEKQVLMIEGVKP
ncbi:hypothetical protein KJ969_03660 [Patescibacteria group bacterium]|nr:hypothetical protein [Patescibacteria group bacterium]MBU1921998.1 hypothetical protein [Patescibacteria group bacterium]